MTDSPDTLRGPDGRLYRRALLAAEQAGFSHSYVHALHSRGAVRGLKHGRLLYVLPADVIRVRDDRPLPKVKQALQWLSAHPRLLFERIDDARTAMKRDGILLNWGQAKAALSRSGRLLPRRGVRLAYWLEEDAARRHQPWPILRQQAERALGFVVSEHCIRYAVWQYDKRHGRPCRPGPEWITYEEAQALLAAHKKSRQDGGWAKRATVLRNARDGGVPMIKRGRRLYFLRPALLAHLDARGYGTKERAIRAYLEAHPEAFRRGALRQVARETGWSYATMWKVANLMRQEEREATCAD